jgi:protein O-GlcNAc transferase
MSTKKASSHSRHAVHALGAAPGSLSMAIARHKDGRLADAESGYLSSLREKPQVFDALHLLGLVHLSRKQHLLSIALIRSALAIHPGNAVAHGNLGNALLELKRYEEATVSYRNALTCQPDHVEAYNNLGNALKAQGQFEEAIGSYRKALEIKPDYATAHNNMGNALQDLKRPQEAVPCYRKAVALRPGYAEAHYNLGKALQELKEYDQAIECYRRALALKPDYIAALTNLGGALQELKRHEEAIACYHNILALNPGYAIAYSNLANSLKELKRFSEASAFYHRALEIDPGYADAWYNFGNALQDMRNHEEAVACYRNVIEIAPRHAEAHNNLGHALWELRKYEEAIACCRKALELQPDHPYAFGMLAAAEMKICDWQDIGHLTAEVRRQAREGRSVVSPFTLLAFSDSLAEQRSCAERSIRDSFPQLPPALWNGERYHHDRIRIAYLSADFQQHATAYLMAELFELHDKSRFELTGISFGPDDQSAVRARLVAAFDRFHDVRAKSDREVAQLLRELEIDIAIDLKGFTQNSRIGILAHRPAPVQVSYLGYPGTTGAEFIDYVIGDRWVTPFDQQAYFSERIVQLPDCYQVNDSKRAIANDIPARAACGLPGHGFVFCCFNNNYKIVPEIFDIWMRLLKRTPGSVLWLLGDNAVAENNLRMETEARGIDPARLVFAPRLPLERHLARHRHADLFLDTLPINAHTTASDALWAGLPILTCLGVGIRRQGGCQPA